MYEKTTTISQLLMLTFKRQIVYVLLLLYVIVIC